MLVQVPVADMSGADEIAGIWVLPGYVVTRVAKDVPVDEVKLVIAVNGHAVTLPPTTLTKVADPTGPGAMIAMKCDFTRHLLVPGATAQVWVYGFLMHEQTLTDHGQPIAGGIEGIQDGHVVGWAAHLLGEALPPLSFDLDGTPLPRAKIVLFEHELCRYVPQPACTGFRIRLPRQALDGANHRFKVRVGDAELGEPAAPTPPTEADTARTADPLPDYAFDREYYRDLYSDIADVLARHPGFDLAEHFWDCGVDEGRLPSLFVDIEFVQQRLSKIYDPGPDRRETLLHFFLLPKTQRFVPNRWFSATVFRKLYRDLLPEGLTDYELFEFYMQNVGGARLSPSGLFDEGAYRDRYPDVDAFVHEGRFRSGFHHFMVVGWRVGRENLEQFGETLFPSGKRGEEQRETLLRRATDLRQIVPWFVETFYLDIYPDVREQKRRGELQSGLEHFLVAGCREGRVPHPAMLATVQQAAGDLAGFFTKVRAAPFPPGLVSLDDASVLYDHLCKTPEDCGVVGPVIWPYVARPWIDGSFNAERYLAANPDLAQTYSHDPGGAADHWRAHGIREGRRAPGSNVFAHRVLSALDVLRGGKGVNVFGPLSLPTGLGAATRGYIEALRDAGVEVDLYDVSGLLHSGARIDVFAPNRLRHSINLVFLNPDQVLSLADRYGARLFDHRVNVGFWVWELPIARPEWRSTFAAFDLIVTPSDFCTNAFAGETDARVATIPYMVDRERLDAHLAAYEGNRWIDLLGEQKRQGRKIVLFIMDASSYTVRKGVDVFLRVAERVEQGRPGQFTFVLKTHSRDHFSGRDLKDTAPASVIVIDEIFSWPDLCKLKQSADLFISPHRSEGFGLNIFESIVLGVPVICSSFGGGPDALPADFPFFIGGRLKEIGEQLGPYRPSSIWFEPDPESAVERLLAFFDDEAKHRRYFARLQTHFLRELSAEAVGTRLCDLLKRHCGLWLDREPLAELFDRSRRECFDLQLGSALSDGSQSVNAMVQSCFSPLFSVITPTWNTDPAWLHELYADLCAQTLQSWEWCLYDDGSTQPETLRAVRALRAADVRIKLQVGHSNAGISEATNRAVRLSSGEFLVFVDHDDRVAPGLLAAYAAVIDDGRGADILYCDEDKLFPDGTRQDHYFKPDWSPEHLLSTMYVLHCLCARKSLFLQLDGYRADYSGAQDHDFLLRATTLDVRVRHVDQVLYHWRLSHGSAALSPGSKPYAHHAGRRAVADHLRRLKLQGTVEDGLLPGTYRVRPAVPEGLVSLNILTSCARRAGDGSLYVERLVRSILAHTYPVEIEIRVVVDRPSLRLAEPLADLGPQVRIVEFDRGERPFNFSEKANFAIRGSATERVVLMNDDMEAMDGEWLGALLELLELPKVGVVGGRLLHGDDTVQHSGVVLGINGSACHVFVGAAADYVGYNAFTHVIRNYSAVTGALMAFRRTLFDRVGGLDPEFPIDFNDTDFCLRVLQAGERVVFTPFAQMRHFESRSAVRLAADSYDEYRFRRKWPQHVAQDPYYNRNLSRDSSTFEAASYA